MVKPKNKSPISLRDSLKIAENIAITTRAFFQAWWVLIGDETQEVYRLTQERHFEYFKYSRLSLLTSMVVNVGVLGERSKRAISLPRLIEQCKKDDGQIIRVRHELDEAERIYTGCATFLNKVLTLRHLLFAHRNAYDTWPEVFQEVDIKPNDFQNLTADLVSVACKLVLSAGERNDLENQGIAIETRAVLKILYEADEGLEHT